MFQWEPLQAILCVLLTAANPSLTCPLLLVPQVEPGSFLLSLCHPNTHAYEHLYLSIYAYMHTYIPKSVSSHGDLQSQCNTSEFVCFLPFCIWNSVFQERESCLPVSFYTFTELMNPTVYKPSLLHDRGPPSQSMWKRKRKKKKSHSLTLTSIHHSS